MAQQVTGWAGKILRVDLTKGTIKTLPTSKYQKFIGGVGIGYKVLFDEVPQGTKAFDKENKIFVGIGPLTGTGAPLSGRTSITSLSPMSPYSVVTDSHFGGIFGPVLKYAGWDGIIIEGASDAPVWLRIEDDKVTIEDATDLWGKGTMETAYRLSKIMGKEATFASIGQAGENLVPSSTVINEVTHYAGGHGGVFGSKKLKAIGVKGTQSAKIAAGKSAAWLELNRFVLSDIIGSNNNHVAPTTQQSWNEYVWTGSRWTGRPGLFWGAANPKVETGESVPGNVNKVAYRCQKAVFDLGAEAEARTIKMGGCHSCPIRCQTNITVPELEKYGLAPYGGSTCAGFGHGLDIMLKGVKAADGKLVTGKNGTPTIVAKALGTRLADDYGIWNNYSQLQRDFEYAYNSGTLKKVLPADEYAAIGFDKMEAGDPAFLLEFYKRIALGIGEFSHMGDGAGNISKRWNFGEDFYKYEYSIWNKKFGYPKHHSTESDAQVGGLINILKNRDQNNHSHQNFINNGLPTALAQEIAAERWGKGSLDAPSEYTPVNQGKINFVKFSWDRNLLHDSLTVCDWTWPFVASPSKARNYRGDTALEAKFFSLATGIETSEAELDLAAERITTLFRALCVLELGTIDMRNEHDLLPEWIYEDHSAAGNLKPFQKGTQAMDKADMQLGMSMLYKAYGWDEKSGAPTRETLVRLGLTDVADKLAKMNLLPASAAAAK